MRGRRWLACGVRGLLPLPFILSVVASPSRRRRGDSPAQGALTPRAHELVGTRCIAPLDSDCPCVPILLFPSRRCAACPSIASHPRRRRTDAVRHFCAPCPSREVEVAANANPRGRIPILFSIHPPSRRVAVDVEVTHQGALTPPLGQWPVTLRELVVPRYRDAFLRSYPTLSFLFVLAPSRRRVVASFGPLLGMRGTGCGVWGLGLGPLPFTLSSPPVAVVMRHVPASPSVTSPRPSIA
ncbi:hypothetical protein B0H16DRAFT_1737506 [Mycena metata]|uniref:Secreted protein n=1 Tax=Mycena metata TaxID=1033252 RepID=A0AAD7HLE3_9AGAR|nr:hypothetical protein B0H16DRAFT_1737506 [Mycena metata]